MSDDYAPALVLHRCWGVASDVREDGFVNPSSVTYAPSEASAIKKARILAGVAVTCLVAEWEPVIRPATTPTTTPATEPAGLPNEESA